MYNMKYIFSLLGILSLITISINPVQAQDLQAELERKLAMLDSLNAQMQSASEKGDAELYNNLMKEWEMMKEEVSALKSKMQADKETQTKALAAFNEGNAHLKAGRYNEAVNSFKKSIELDPLNAQVYYNLGYAYLKLRNDAEAQEAFLKAVKYNANYTAAYLALGNLAERMKKDKDALSYYRKAIDLNDKEAKAFCGIGNIHLRNNRFKEAETYYQQAISIDSSYFDAWMGIGRAQKEQGKLDTALESFNKASEINKKDPKTFLFIAEIYNKNGKYQLALESVEKSIALDKNNAAAWYEKGVSLMGLNRKNEAISAFEQAKKDRNWREISEHQIKVCKGQIPK